MKKTAEQLEAYRIARQELQNTLSGDAEKDCQIYNDLWYLDFMEKGGIISEDGGFLTDSEELIKKVKTRYQNDSMTAWWTKQKNWTVKNGVNGFLVEPENVDKLAEAMIKIQLLDLNVASKYQPSNDKDFNRLFE